VAVTDEELRRARDEVVRELRTLALGAPDALPGDVPLKGILGRAEELLAAQAPNIDALAAHDLLADEPDAHERLLEVLTRALHVPRMVVALGEVLRQDAKSDALRASQQEAARVVAKVQQLYRLWALRQAGLDATALDDDEVDV
jgi:hypothetical protein